VTDEELTRIEDLVNERIRENAPVTTTVLPVDDAMKQGATALFGEKYGAVVRMVAMGEFSRELCGGTHAKQTGEIGLFKVITEGGIAAGVRRIEAVTGRGALEYLRELEAELDAIAERVRGTRGELARKLDKLIEEKKAREKEIEALKSRLASGKSSDILDGARETQGIRVLAKLVEEVDNPKDLRDYADRVRDKIGSGVALLAAKAEDKALLIALVTKDLTKRFHAGEIVKSAALKLGGSGGGRPDMAQAGGPNFDGIPDALKVLDEVVESH
jgi:alanyl-tRNA synthetase